MNTTAIRKTYAVMVGLALSLLMLLSLGRIAQADVNGAIPPDHTTKGIKLQKDMRQLWEEHVLWTRMVILSVAGDQKDLSPAIDRLMQNQVDIGNAIKPYYGGPAGEKLTSLLKDHISTAGEILVAAKAGDNPKVADAKKRWYSNGDDIAIFLSGANPANWPVDSMKQMMKTHLDTTLDEATARLNGDWKGDVAAFDKARMHVLMMADGLSEGIIKQFPDKFADDTMNTSSPTIKIDMPDSKFVPSDITASAGTTITWTNIGKHNHTVTADSTNTIPGGPDSKTAFPKGIRPGESFSWTVPMNAAHGTKWFYRCVFHGSEGDGSVEGSGMSGSITIN